MNILLAVHSPNLIGFVIIAAIILGLGLILKYFKQPYVIAYILSGVLIGRYGLELVTNEELIINLGEFGLILLMFFIGMEIDLPEFIKSWKIPLFGTVFQVLISVGVIMVVGRMLDWNMNRIIVIGFVISLSSSAVVIKFLQDSGESSTKLGQQVISILIMQDIIIVPLLLITNFVGGSVISSLDVVLQLVGALFIVGMIFMILLGKRIKIKIIEKISRDHELQVFFGFIVCFGFSALTGFFGLSAALGAFVAGLWVHSSRSADWFHDALHSFRVVFVSVFFLSIGMLIDLNFLKENWTIILILLLLVLVANHVINTVILYFFNRRWKDSIYGGALLSQIGELSFLLVSAAIFNSIITDYAYQLIIITISLSLLISPFWISMTKRLTGMASFK